MSGPARVWFALTAVVVVVALVIQIPATAANAGSFFTTPAGRVGNLFAYFTILTNLLVACVGVALALRGDRGSTLFRTLRLDALLGIAVTGIVYHTLLTDLEVLPGTELANQLFHTVSPILGVLGWVLFGPRGWIDRRIVAWSLVYPLAWLAVTLVRGALIGWYPYPFVDVTTLGYGRVALNCLGVAVLFLVLAALARWVDGLLARSRQVETTAR